MVYAELARRQGDDIRLMASIETVGYYSSEPSSQNYPPLLNLFYPDRANFISIISNFRSRAAMRQHFVQIRIFRSRPRRPARLSRQSPGATTGRFGAKAIAP